MQRTARWRRSTAGNAACRHRHRTARLAGQIVRSVVPDAVPEEEILHAVVVVGHQVPGTRDEGDEATVGREDGQTTVTESEHALACRLIDTIVGGAVGVDDGWCMSWTARWSRGADVARPPLGLLLCSQRWPRGARQRRSHPVSSASLPLIAMSNGAVTPRLAYDDSPPRTVSGESRQVPRTATDSTAESMRKGRCDSTRVETEDSGDQLVTQDACFRMNSSHVTPADLRFLRPWAWGRWESNPHWHGPKPCVSAIGLRPLEE